MPTKRSKNKAKIKTSALKFTQELVRELEDRITGERAPESDVVDSDKCIEYAKSAIRKNANLGKDGNDDEFSDLCRAFYWLYAAYENSGCESGQASAMMADLLRDYYEESLNNQAGLEGKQAEDSFTGGAEGEERLSEPGSAFANFVKSQVVAAHSDVNRFDERTINFMVNARLTSVMQDIADDMDSEDENDNPPLFVPEECMLLLRFHEPAYSVVDKPSRHTDLIRYSGIDGNPDFAIQIAEFLADKTNNDYFGHSNSLIRGFLEVLGTTRDKDLMFGIGVPAEAGTMIALGFLNGCDMEYSPEKANFWLRYAMTLGSPRAWFLHALFFSKTGRIFSGEDDCQGYILYASDLIQAVRLCQANHEASGNFFRFGPRMITCFYENGKQRNIECSLINSLVNVGLVLRDGGLDLVESVPEFSDQLVYLFLRSYATIGRDDPALRAAAAGLALINYNFAQTEVFAEFCDGRTKPKRKKIKSGNDQLDALEETFALSSGIIRGLVNQHPDLVTLSALYISPGNLPSHKSVIETYASRGYARAIAMLALKGSGHPDFNMIKKAADLGQPLCGSNYAFLLINEGKGAEAEKYALLSLRNGLMQAYYALGLTYLNTGRTELGCTCMRYAADYLFPPAITLLEDLKKKHQYRPLPFMRDLESLEKLSETSASACKVLSAISMMGFILPKDRVSALMYIRKSARLGDFDSSSHLCGLFSDIWHDVPQYSCVPDISEGYRSRSRYLSFLSETDDPQADHVMNITKKMRDDILKGGTWLERDIAVQIESSAECGWLLDPDSDPNLASHPHGLLPLCQDFLEMLTIERSHIESELKINDPLSRAGRALKELTGKKDDQWRRIRTECGMLTAMRGLSGIRVQAIRRLALEGFNCDSDLCAVVLGTELGPVFSELGHSFIKNDDDTHDTVVETSMDQ